MAVQPSAEEALIPDLLLMQGNEKKPVKSLKQLPGYYEHFLFYKKCSKFASKSVHMETPFVFGRIATDRNFTDREVETDILKNNFKSLINTIIISPRRWGKSSLVNKAAQQSLKEDPQLRIVQMDLFNVRDEKQFFMQFAKSVISATSSRMEEIIENAKKFLSSLVPRISISADYGNEVSLDLDWRGEAEDADLILALPEKIAKEKGIRIVVCIDEFQNVAELDPTGFLQRRLRSHWQRQQSVAYCLYGSKRHMMLDVFTDSSKPFYKFGNLMFLQKIGLEHLVQFFKQRFEDTGKHITEEAAVRIATLVDCHPYYAQQLAQLAWLRTDKECTPHIVEEAHVALVEQLSLLFVNITENLTLQQVRVLNAIVNGETSLSSEAVMKRYGVNSSVSASRAKQALIGKDIIDVMPSAISMQDPIYAYWLKNSYF